MDIRYIDPLTRAVGRMKQALFQPFDLKKWFVVGFTAFLAGLTDCGGNGGGGGGRGAGRVDWDELIYFPRHAQEWLLENPHWFIVIAFGVVLLVSLMVVLTWVSSRGKFMFLDNVVHNRALVSASWYEYRIQGNSLFLWCLAFGLAVLVIIVPYLVSCYGEIVEIYEQSGEPSALLLPVIRMALGFLGIIVVTSFVELLLVDFVVPIMYRSRLRVLDAWGVFLPLLGAHLFSFIGYGLFILVLTIAVALGVVVAVLLTCCIGVIPLIIPYIHSVVLLPISYTMRAFSLEFLGQCGPEFQMFPPPGEAGNTGVQGIS